MTKMASYEANKGKKDLATGKYFRSDYITLQLLKAIFSGTMAFVIVIGIALLYDFDAFMKASGKHYVEAQLWTDKYITEEYLIK